MAPHLEELYGVILTLTSYDPNFYDTGDSQDAPGEGFDEFDADGLVDADDDDYSWKVRRASLKVLAATVRQTASRMVSRTHLP